MLDIAKKPVTFAWQLIGNGDLTLAVVPGSKGSGQRLLIDGKTDVTRPVLTQLVVLDPGRYWLSWRSGTDGGQASDRVLALNYSPLTEDVREVADRLHDARQRVERGEMLLPVMIERLEQHALLDLPPNAFLKAFALGNDRGVGRIGRHCIGVVGRRWRRGTIDG